ncbi:uncharacterized protein [Lepisosteus oculatus]|uniref:uncharacterized protein n=1 Tax=Lepisosteus oculatus TaxID=7918 RepID=UPI0035F51A37
MTVLGVVLTVFCSQVCSALLSVSGLYGDTVALPCDGSSYRHTPEEKKIIQWQTADRRVLEFYSGQIHTYPGCENRAELSRERIKDGAFSLILHNVTFSDQDIYECRFVDDKSKRKFLGDVKLTVQGHEDNIGLSWGDPLSVPLRTQQAVELWFRPEGGESRRLCSVLDSTVTPDSSRLKVQDQVLKISSVRAEDGGTYTVQDSQGNPISTVHVTVGAQSEVLTLQSGDNLSLPLHTAAPVKVLFHPAGSAQSPRVLLNSTGLPGPGYEQRVWVQDGSLTLCSLTPADQGSYTVRDLHGNAISTAIVTVTGGEMSSVSWPVSVAVITAIVAVLMGAGLGAVCCKKRWKMREERNMIPAESNNINIHTENKFLEGSERLSDAVSLHMEKDDGTGSEIVPVVKLHYTPVPGGSSSPSVTAGISSGTVIVSDPEQRTHSGYRSQGEEGELPPAGEEGWAVLELSGGSTPADPEDQEPSCCVEERQSSLEEALLSDGGDQ